MFGKKVKWRRRLLRNQCERLRGRTDTRATHTLGVNRLDAVMILFWKKSAIAISCMPQHEEQTLSSSPSVPLRLAIALPNWKMDLCVFRTNAISKHWPATDAVDRPTDTTSKHTLTHTHARTDNNKLAAVVHSLLQLEGGNCLCVLHENNKIHKSHKYRISNDLCSKNVNQNPEKPIVRRTATTGIQWQWRNATAADRSHSFDREKWNGNLLSLKFNLFVSLSHSCSCGFRIQNENSVRAKMWHIVCRPSFALCMWKTKIALTSAEWTNGQCASHSWDNKRVWREKKNQKPQPPKIYRFTASKSKATAIGERE